MSKDLILRSRAAKYLNTSIVVMTEAEYKQYLINVINFNYPRLKDNLPELYKHLTFDENKRDVPNVHQYTQTIEKSDENLDLYEWWLTTPTGPRSCSRDIGEVRGMFSVGKGDEWDKNLEEAIITYQEKFPEYLKPTGYVCAETLRRKRMVV